MSSSSISSHACLTGTLIGAHLYWEKEEVDRKSDLSVQQDSVRKQVQLLAVIADGRSNSHVCFSHLA